ncbi:MAG: HEAT repeat domain-containing protein [Chloroflexota bacterium]
MQSQVNTQSKQVDKKQQYQSEPIEHWLSSKLAIAPLYEMPKEQIAQFTITDEGLEQLMRGVNHPNPDVRWWCAYTMGSMTDVRCIRPFRRLAKDKSVAVRAEVIRGLGWIYGYLNEGHTDIRKILLEKALSDPDGQVQVMAIEAMAKVTPILYPAVVLFRIYLNPTNSLAVRCAAQDAFQQYKHILPEEEQTAAAELQEQLQGKVLTAEELVKLLGARHRIVHWAANDALLDQGPAVMDAVLAGFNSPIARIRGYCAAFMDHMGDDRCIEPLIALTYDPVPRVRREAMHSLLCDRCKSAPLNVNLVSRLIEILSTEDDVKIRSQVVHGLSLQPYDERVQPMLVPLLEELDAKEALTKPERNLRKGIRLALRQHTKYLHI